MRIPFDGEDLIGKVCVCSTGRPAIVVGRKTIVMTDRFGGLGADSWIGLGLDGKGVWSSTKPCVIAESGEEFFDRLMSRFGGKMI